MQALDLLAQITSGLFTYLPELASSAGPQG